MERPRACCVACGSNRCFSAAEWTRGLISHVRVRLRVYTRFCVCVCTRTRGVIEASPHAWFVRFWCCDGVRSCRSCARRVLMLCSCCAYAFVCLCCVRRVARLFRSCVCLAGVPLACRPLPHRRSHLRPPLWLERTLSWSYTPENDPHLGCPVQGVTVAGWGWGWSGDQWLCHPQWSPPQPPLALVPQAPNGCGQLL